MQSSDLVRVLGDQFVCERCHADGGWLKVARPVPRKNSSIHRLQCARCGEQIVAKVSPGGESRASAREHLRREYETLCALQRLFPQEEHYGTLVPLGYLESADRGIVITQYFRGEDLSHQLRPMGAPGVLETCRSAGTWLRKLHESGDSGAQGRGLGVPEKLSYLTDAYGEVLRGNTKVWNAYRCLEREGARIDTSEFATVQLHGDFKPENMLCDGVRYVGLDVQWRTAGPAVYDLAPFLNHLWLAQQGLASSENRQYPSAEAGFLAGYGYAGETRVLRWAQLYFALCQLGGYRQRGSLAASYASWKVWPLVRRLTGQLEHVA